MQTKHAIYAGSFDPPTCGHLHVIHKACKIFDRVTVLVSDDPNKKYMFRSDKRLSMVTEMITGIANADASVLPPHQYVASYAHQQGAKFLVRGIRDSMDYNAEQKLCRTNKEIQEEVETVYVMPDDFYSIVSSSWVKSMIGYYGWRDILQDKVSPGVMMVLKEEYLTERWKRVSEKYDPYNYTNMARLERILAAYRSRPYHNLDHLIDCIEVVDKYALFLNYRDILFALFFHDFKDSEEASCEGLPDHIKSLVMATKHTNPENCKTDNERFIASVDLAILASPWGKYEAYAKNVAKEYLAKGVSASDYRKGRIEFLQKMLEREAIYLHKTIYDDMEVLARANIEHEISNLTYDSAFI